MSCNAESDINGFDLAQKIENLPSIPSHTTALETLSLIHEKQLEELYSSLCIALRIAVTLPVTVASAEKKFLQTLPLSGVKL